MTSVYTVGFASAAFVGVPSITITVSSGSTSVSSYIAIVSVVLVEPAGITRGDDAAIV